MGRHVPFQPLIIRSAVLLGLFGGFGIGAHMVYLSAFGYVPGRSFAAMMQVHGHLQLLGWTGLFIIGVSLYKLPRLASSPTLRLRYVRTLGVLLVGGLLLRSAAQLLLFYSEQQQMLLRLLVAGGLFESTAIALYLAGLTRPMLSFNAQSGAVAAAALKPFLLVSFVGWAAYAVLNALAAVGGFSTDTFLFTEPLHSLVIECYIYLVLLPTCFAFSLSTFPIFLRLRAPDWAVGRLALCYGTAAALSLVAGWLAGDRYPGLADVLRAVGIAGRTAAVLIFLYKIDLLRLHAPWFRKFRDTHDREHRPPRRNAADYGQFGNFEWLIYAAYVWLAAGALAELAALLTPHALPATIVRHLYLLGFVTHLILGMAVRIVPGFLGSNRIAYPSLVRISFALILLATIGRIGPFLHSFFHPLLNLTLIRPLYGVSGILAMLAVLALGVNLFATVRQERKPLS